MHLLAVERNIRKLLQKFEELCRADNRVRNGTLFDQFLLCEFCAEEAAIKETVCSHDRQCNVVCNPCLRFVAEQIACGCLEELEHGSVFPGRRIRYVDDR